MAITRQIKKMPDGTYFLKVIQNTPDKFGKRRSKSKKGIKTASLVQKYACEFESILEKGDFNKDITFSELEQTYYNYASVNMSPTTLSKLYYQRPLILNYFGDKIKAKNLNTLVVQDFINYLQTKRNLKKSSAVSYFTHVRSVLNWGVKKDILEYNRVKKIDYIEDKEEFEATTINEEQLAKALLWIKKNHYNIYIPVLLAASSNRRGEAMGIRKEFVNLEEKYIIINHNLVQTKNGPVDLNKLKSGKRKKIMPLSNFVATEIKEHLERYTDPESPYLYSTIFSGEEITPSSVSKAFHKIMKKQFGIDMRMHDLRHSFSQMTYEDGIDDVTRSKLLQHHDPKFTNKVYTKFSLSKGQNAMNSIYDKVSEVFNSKTKDTK